MNYSLPHILFEATTRCNLNCRYCYNIWKRPGHSVEHSHSYKSAKKILKRLFAIADVQHVTFTGGEPFLSERFPELVLYSRMKKKSVTIISNGTAATKDDYSAMKELGVGLFEFPLHSYNPEIHDYLANAPGAWERSHQSVIDVLSLGVSVVAVIVIARPNFVDIEKTLRFLVDCGITSIMMNRFNIGGQGIVEQGNLIITGDELRVTFEKANNFLSKHTVSLSSNVCTPYCLLNPKDYPNIAFGHCAADVIDMPITLECSGNLRLCNHSPVVIGNIFQDNLNTIFSSNYINEWSRVPSFCAGCEWFNECRGGCRAASEQLGLGCEKEDPILNFL